MDDLPQDASGMTPRRSFTRRVAGAMALGLAGLVPGPLQAQLAAARSDGPAWPGPLKGRHRQLVDAYAVNDGAPLAFAYTFLSTNEPPSASLVSATAVIVLRHAAFPMALGNEMWRKYKIGEAFKILDPQTKAPAVKNPFLHPKPGVLPVDGMAIDLLLANGTVGVFFALAPTQPPAVQHLSFQKLASRAVRMAAPTGAPAGVSCTQ